ncbi:MAG: hypothetical protein HY705_09205 [Gemmatimonadetes bacterium]|nr:hypothetical protein [Gemmatimonadota bacterium]
MNPRLLRWSPVLAATALLAACADAPGPVGPSGTPQFQRVANQAQVADWFTRSSPAVLALVGTVFADHDEVANRLIFGVENEAAVPGVRNALAQLGIPATAYDVEVTEPIRMVATLRDRWRPTQGGIQIHFGQFLCTLGFNADDGAERSFITASHCTKRQGGVEGTEYFQPTSTVDPTVIATEVEDPAYFRGGACPKGRKCRYSDAARALYSADVGSTRGAIAKTSAPNTGSLEVTGAFTITSQDNATSNFALGTTVNKVGRTTGWTQGNVTRTCVNTNVSGTNITQLCQTFVEDPGGAVIVGGGDSGSNVFRITAGDNVELVGILWGGNSSGTLFVFSPLKQVQDELGALTTTQ